MAAFESLFLSLSLSLSLSLVKRNINKIKQLTHLTSYYMMFHIHETNHGSDNGFSVFTIRDYVLQMR